MSVTITSSQNPLIRHVLQLKAKSKVRKKSGLFVIEGRREIDLAIKGGYRIEKLLFCSEIVSEPDHLPPGWEVEYIEISKAVYRKIAYRESTEGLIAIAHMKKLGLDDLKFESDKPLILVAESPEKPGNIGALLRTADSAKLDAVIIAAPHTDMFNPNIIRSSIGCLFTIPVAVGSNEEVMDFLKQRGISIFAASLQSSKKYYDCDFTGGTAIVVGTESKGLTAIWTDNSWKNIYVPMEGEIDSMNVSVAAGIIIFEAKRQRRQSHKV